MGLGSGKASFGREMVLARGLGELWRVCAAVVMGGGILGMRQLPDTPVTRALNIIIDGFKRRYLLP